MGRDPRQDARLRFPHDGGLLYGRSQEAFSGPTGIPEKRGAGNPQIADSRSVQSLAPRRRSCRYIMPVMTTGPLSPLQRV